MKHGSRVISTLLIIMMISAVILAACTPAAPTTQAIKDKELNLLCTPQEEWCQGMKQEFETKYGITVNYVRMSAGEALARLAG